MARTKRRAHGAARPFENPVKRVLNMNRVAAVPVNQGQIPHEINVPPRRLENNFDAAAENDPIEEVDIEHLQITSNNNSNKMNTTNGGRRTRRKRHHKRKHTRRQ